MHTNTINPDDALKWLKEGNDRFCTGSVSRPNADAGRRRETAVHGQAPFAAVLACSDSRGPVELLFDRGIGDLFVVRVAGNVIGPSELGSIEYAVDHLGTPIFLVLGHTKCGAVTAVVEAGLLPGNLRALSERILPAAEKVKASGCAADSLVLETVKANVWKVIEDAFASSESIRQKVKDGELKVIAAYYDLETGKVAWMGEHPAQAELPAR